MNYYKIYEIAGPLLLTPLAVLLWFSTAAGNYHLLICAISLPIIWGFIVPFVGIRILNVWELKSRFSNKGFRPHHGFLFGSATSVIGWLIYTVHMRISAPAPSWLFPFSLGVLLGIVNYLFDSFAIKQKVLFVYNSGYSRGHSPLRIALQYAPVFFGSFGIVYGLIIQQAAGHKGDFNLMSYLVAVGACLLASPVFTEITHLLFYRESSFKSYKPR